MSAGNPFIAAMGARAWRETGNVWARLALVCKDRAALCWANSARCLDIAETESRELARRVDAARTIDEWAVEVPNRGHIGQVPS